jgi:hypothetical protein
MIQRTIEEQELLFHWHKRRRERRTPRSLLHETDELLFWLEECLVQELKIVPGWLTARLVQLLNRADPRLTSDLGRERRPLQVMEVLYKAQGHLMQESIQGRVPAKIIPLFRA